MPLFPGLRKTLSDELLVRFRMVGDMDAASGARARRFIRVGVSPRSPGGIAVILWPTAAAPRGRANSGLTSPHSPQEHSGPSRPPRTG